MSKFFFCSGVGFINLLLEITEAENNKINKITHRKDKRQQNQRRSMVYNL
jgi:hypothetical protein